MKFPFRNYAVVTVFIVAAAFSGVIAAGCGSQKTAVSEEHKTIYQCSMHPQVISDKPGNCPICGMKLTRVENGSGKMETGPENSVPGYADVFISEGQQRLIGMKIAEVKRMPLAVKIRALGRVGYDHDVYEAIADYQEAAIKYRNLKGSPSTIVKERLEQIHELSMLQLRLLGLSDMQISELTHSGQLPTHYELPHGQHWLYADLYEFEAGLVHAGDKVTIKAPAFPGEVHHGTVKSVDTVLTASSRITRARIATDASAMPLLPGITADVEIEASLGEKLAIPAEAVMDTGERQIVFVDSGDSHFEPRVINAGHKSGDFVEILSGLKEGERVVASATFLIDSESRLRAASLPKTGGSSESQPAAAHQHGG